MEWIKGSAKDANEVAALSCPVSARTRKPESRMKVEKTNYFYVPQS